MFWNLNLLYQRAFKPSTIFDQYYFLNLKNVTLPLSPQTCLFIFLVLLRTLAEPGGATRLCAHRSLTAISHSIFNYELLLRDHLLAVARTRQYEAQKVERAFAATVVVQRKCWGKPMLIDMGGTKFCRETISLISPKQFFSKKYLFLQRKLKKILQFSSKQLRLNKLEWHYKLAFHLFLFFSVLFPFCRALRGCKIFILFS